MDNLVKIKKLSKKLHLLISLLLVAIPLYYVIYWTFINSFQETLITVGVDSTPLIPNTLSIKWQLAGFCFSLLPLAALIYGLSNMRKLFSLGNPPGQRTLSVGFSSPELTTLVVAGIVFVIAWVMDEGRILTEEQQLTV